MKKPVKLLSLVMAVIFVISSIPFSVFADDYDFKLNLSYSGIDSATVTWDYNFDASYNENIAVQKSSNGRDWFDADDSEYYGYSGEAEIYLAPKQAYYYRVKLNYTSYVGSKTDTVVKYSDALFISPNMDQIANDINSYLNSEKNSANLTFSLYSSDRSFVDGFIIQQSVNGSDYRYYTTVDVNSISGNADYSLYAAVPSNVGYLMSFRIYPYYNFNNKTYSSSAYAQESNSYVDSDLITLKTKKSSVDISIKYIPGASYKINYTPYNIKKNKYSGTKTVWTGSTKYSIKNNSKNTALYIDVTPYWGSQEGYSSSAYSHEGMALLKGAGKSKSKKIKVINVKGKKDKTAWTEALTKKDKKIIKNFFYKKYRNKKVSREEKALYAFNWIHTKVKYDYKYSVGNLSYTEAIFKKKKGQCLQYNGAMAKVLTYLGYETRIINGKRRGNIQHFWCEVKINGRWYLVETGNEGKNGDWQHFVELYNTGDGYGYLKHGKKAKD